MFNIYVFTFLIFFIFLLLIFGGWEEELYKTVTTRISQIRKAIHQCTKWFK